MWRLPMTTLTTTNGDILVIAEFNKNHDKAGRFATGNGNGSTDLSDVTEQEWNGDFADRTFGTVNLSKDVVAEAEAYFDMGHSSINAKLREYKGNVNAVPDSYFPGIVNALDTATNSHTLSKDYTIYRGTTINLDLLKVGSKIKDHGYSSASFSKHRAKEFLKTALEYGSNNNAVIIKLVAPKGTKGFIPSASNIKMVIKGEAEFVLKRGTTYTVTKLIPKDGYTLLEATL